MRPPSQFSYIYPHKFRSMDHLHFQIVLVFFFFLTAKSNIKLVLFIHHHIEIIYEDFIWIWRFYMTISTYLSLSEYVNLFLQYFFNFFSGSKRYFVSFYILIAPGYLGFPTLLVLGKCTHLLQSFTGSPLMSVVEKESITEHGTLKLVISVGLSLSMWGWWLIFVPNLDFKHKSFSIILLPMESISNLKLRLPFYLCHFFCHLNQTLQKEEFTTNV